MKLFILSLVFTGSMSSAVAQTDTLNISLDDIWKRADLYSRAVVIKRKAVALSREEVKDAQAGRLPDWNIGGNAEKATNIPVYENGVFNPPVQHDVIHTLYRAGSDFYLNIYDGNKLNLKVSEDRILLGLAEIEADQAVSDIRYRAASLYLELRKSIVFRDLITRDIADQEKQRKEVADLYRNGVVLKSDLLRVELDLSKRKMTLVQIQNDILIANQKLNILIGEPDDCVIRPVDGEFPAQAPDPVYEDCLETALQHSFAYRLSERQTQLSGIHLKQVKAASRLTIGLYGEFYYANPQIFLYPYNPSWYSLGVGGIKASFPLSSFYHNVHKDRAAKLEWENQEEEHRETGDQVRQQVRETYLRYEEALIQIDVARANVDQATENARIIKNTYFNHTSLITDLLDADIQVLQTRFELAAAQLMAQNKYYLLQNVMGIL